MTTTPTAASSAEPSILVVWDDDPGAADLVARLNAHGFSARAAAPTDVRRNGTGGSDPADLALVDLAPEGISAAARLGEGPRGVPVVYLTDDPDAELLTRALPTRPFGYVARPVADGQLRLSVKSALAVHAREREHRDTERRLERRIATMRARQRLMSTIIDSVSDGVVAADARGDYIVSNRSARMIAGGELPDTELERRPEEWGFFHPDGKTQVQLEELPLSRALKGETTDDFQIVVRNPWVPDGLVHLSICGRPVDLEDGTSGAVLTFRDITRTRKAEEELQRTMGALQDQKELLDTVLDTMTEGVIVTSAEDGRIVYANRSVTEMIAEPVEDLDPSEWAEVYGVYNLDRKTHAEPAEMPISRALHGESTGQEYFIRNDHTPDGTYVSTSAVPLLSGTSGNIIGAVGIIRDITPYKEVEGKLRRTLRETQEQNDLMQAVFMSMTDGMVVADEQGRFTLFNPAAEKIVGTGMMDVRPDEWTGRYGLFHPDCKTRVPIDELPLERAVAGERTVGMELLIRNDKRPDGVYIVANGVPLPRDIGGHGGGVVVFRDITERRKAETERTRALNELREQTELMDTVFESMSDGIIAVDRAGQVIQVNRHAYSLARIEGEVAPSDTWAERYGIFYPDRVTRVNNEDLPVLRAAMKGETVDEEDIVLINRESPEGVTLRISARPIMDPEGKHRGGVAVFRDVTEARRAEDALAEAFAQGKIEMIDTILHNVGNAVNSVTTGIETIDRTLRDDTLVRHLKSLAEALEENREDWIGYIRDDPQGRLVLPFILALAEDLANRDAKIRQAANRAQDRSEHIAAIIRTQRAFKHQAATRKEIALGDSFAKALGLLEHTLSAAGVTVEVDCERAPNTITTYESDLQQTMVNLVRNSVDALKARRVAGEDDWSPRIRIRAWERGSHLVIEVEDNGIGLPSNKLRAIFSAGFTTKEEGTGLGLHSAANFVQRSGGRIRAMSEGVGHGATIRMEMRLGALGVEKG